MSNNWVVENIQNAIDTWNEKFSEIWRLLSQSPAEFKGGTIWYVMTSINGALKAVGYALLVLFFLIGIMKHYNSIRKTVYLLNTRVWRGSRDLLRLPFIFGHGDFIMGMYDRSRTLCGTRLCKIQRTAGGEDTQGMDKKRNTDAPKVTL